MTNTNVELNVVGLETNEVVLSRVATYGRKKGLFSKLTKIVSVIDTKFGKVVKGIGKNVLGAVVAFTILISASGQVLACESIKVKKGDTLTKIAETHEMTVKELKQINGLTSDMIYVGQELGVIDPEERKALEAAEKEEGKKTSTPSVIDTWNQDSSKADVFVNSSKNLIKHTVVSGETLSSIATKYKTTVAKIKKDNNMQSDSIYAGKTTLFIKLGNSNNNVSNEKQQPVPTKVTDTAKKQPVSSTVAPKKGFKYVVKSGDNLWKLQETFGVSIINIMENNGLTTDRLSIGDIIYIDGAKKQVKTTESTPKVEVKETFKSVSGVYPLVHLVEKHDQWFKIAREYGANTDAMLKDNGLNKKSVVKAGIQLKVNNPKTLSATVSVVNAGDPTSIEVKDVNGKVFTLQVPHGESTKLQGLAGTDKDDIFLKVTYTDGLSMASPKLLSYQTIQIKK